VQDTESPQQTAKLALEALELEKCFSANRYAGATANRPILHTQGAIPVVISAPHAVNHPRHGRMKLADTFTGTLALQLSRQTGAPAFVYAQTTSEDPNYDEGGAYKTALASPHPRLRRT
jgi:hypothetical protein